MLLIEKTFELEEYERLIKKEIDIFIFTKPREERGDIESKINNISPSSKVIIMDYIQEENSVNVKLYDVTSKNANDLLLSRNHYELIEYFKTLRCDLKRILIDMTDMDVKLLAMIIAIFRLVSTKKLFVMYTEPKRYLTRKVQREGIDDSNEKCEFEFHDSYQGADAIPFYMHTDVDYTSKQQLWIVFLGFDRNRTNRLYESKNEPSNVIPVITHPSARPGWDKYAFNANFNFISENELLHKIKYISYSSPFHTYQMLDEIYSEYNDHHIIISPLGTKPNTLGVLLFTNIHPDIELLYDNPYIKRARSVGVLKTLIYDVSGLLNV